MNKTERTGIVEVGKSEHGCKHTKVRDGPLCISNSLWDMDELFPELGFYRVTVTVETTRLPDEEAESYEWIWTDKRVGIPRSQWARKQDELRRMMTGRPYPV